MTHSTNITGFLAAAKSSTDPLTRAYCGLVAIELVLKQEVTLGNHNVPSAIKRFATKNAIGQKAGCKAKLDALAVQLHNSVRSISVQGKDYSPRFAPGESYPYIRYARHAGDNWPTPNTSVQQAEALALIVVQVRSYLASKFGKNL